MQSWLVWFEFHMRYLAGIYEEGDILGHSVNVVVVLEFHKGKKIVPIILSLVNKEPKVLFQFLIDSFHLPISLGMVCGSSSQLNSKESIQFLCKFHHKLGSPIQHHFPRQSVMFPYMLKIELGSSGSSQSSDCAYKVATLGDGVDCYQSFPLDSGSSTIKSTLAVSQGVSRIGRGCNSLDGGW